MGFVMELALLGEDIREVQNILDPTNKDGLMALERW
jgi:hypothetical protein